MDATRTGSRLSPLGEFLRTRVERVLAICDLAGAPPGSRSGRPALQRFLETLDQLAALADELAEPKHLRSADRAPASYAVLIVTDDAHLANEVRASLEPDHRVEVVATAELAVQSAIARTPDVVVSAGAAAIETLGRLRELRPGLPALVAAAESEVPQLLAAFAGEPVIVLRTGQELALAIRALLGARDSWQTPAEPARTRPAGESPTWEVTGEPRSYAHLAGLLPRALERTIEFDVGAAVIARPSSDPLVDVHATFECRDETLDLVRERALALFRLVSGGAGRDEDYAAASAPSPLRSSLHVPLVTEGRVIGLTYLASFRPDAFSADDAAVLADLAAHASGAYRRLEASVRRLRLTPRQSQVLALIASGLSDNEVAMRLGLAHRTVRTHLDRLLREHGLRSRTEAVAAWLRGQQE